MPKKSATPQVEDKPVKDNKALDTFLASMDKKYGEGTVVKMNSAPLPIDSISTGSIGLDIACGVGGVPVGRIIEIYGPESSGKTTICTHIIAQAQIKYPDRSVGYVDMEHATDPVYMKALGVDMERLMISQPDNGEQALEIAEAMIKSKAFSVVVVDSVAALVPQKEIEGEMGDATMGAQARLMSQAMRKLSPLLKGSDVTLIFTNQIRMKIGVMFGNPETTTGGNALKFYASLRFDVRKTEQIKEAGSAVANKTRVRVVKNKVAPPFREAEFEIVYGKGISLVSELIELGERYSIIEKRGAFISYNDTRLGQGAANAKQYLVDHPDILEEIKTKIMQASAAESPFENGSAQIEKEDDDE